MGLVAARRWRVPSWASRSCGERSCLWCMAALACERRAASALRRIGRPGPTASRSSGHVCRRAWGGPPRCAERGGWWAAVRGPGRPGGIYATTGLPQAHVARAVGREHAARRSAKGVQTAMRAKKGEKKANAFASAYSPAPMPPPCELQPRRPLCWRTPAGSPLLGRTLCRSRAPMMLTACFSAVTQPAGGSGVAGGPSLTGPVPPHCAGAVGVAAGPFRWPCSDRSPHPSPHHRKHIFPQWLQRVSRREGLCRCVYGGCSSRASGHPSPDAAAPGKRLPAVSKHITHQGRRPIDTCGRVGGTPKEIVLGAQYAAGATAAAERWPPKIHPPRPLVPGHSPRLEMSWPSDGSQSSCTAISGPI